MKKSINIISIKAILICFFALTSVKQAKSQYGNALAFDGSNDYVATGISVGNNTAYTIEFWMNPTSITNGGDERILSSGGSGTSSCGLRFQGGKIECWDGSTWFAVTTSNISTNAWTHFALTCNTSGQIIGYVNGVAEVTSTRSSTFWSSLNIGANYVFTYGSYYLGVIDEFRYWTTTRTQSQIQSNKYTELVGNETGLQVYYKFNQGTGGGTNTGTTTATDAAAHSNGTLSNFALTGTSSNWITSTLTCATTSTTNLSICPSALPYTWNGLTFSGAGTQSKLFTAGNSIGCDSTATLVLTVKSTSSSSTNLTICSNNLPYSWNGLTFSGAGTQTKTGLTNSVGCDSSATLVLSVTTAAPSITAGGATTFCGGSSVSLSVSGTPGNAVTLGSQYINLSSNTNLRAFPKTAFTLETWVKPTSTTGNQLIMYNGLCNQACPTFSLSIGGESGCTGGNVASKYNFKFATSGGNFVLASSTAVVANAWTHVAITYDGSTSMKIYINGSLDNSLTISGTPTNPSNFLFIGLDPTIGGCGSARYAYNGSLDEMRIWNIARSAAQISSNYTGTVATNSSNLILYYQFNSASGTTAVDATSNAYNGTFSGTPTWAASAAFGFTGFSWSPGGATTSSISATATGTYTVTATDASGCIGTVSQSVTANPATTSSTTVAACINYTWNGVTYTTSGTYNKVFTGGNSKGCDSTATLILTINTATTSSTSQTACGSYTWNGVTYTTSGTYNKVFTGGNSKGCDSTATLVLTINPLPTPPLSASGSTTFCSGGSVTLSSGGSMGNAVTLGSQYINLSSNTNLRAFPKTAFTLETWVKPTSTTGNQVLMYNGLCNQACPMFSLSIGGEGGCGGTNVAGKYNFKFSTSGGNFSLASNTAVVANVWAHVAVTYDGVNSMKIYVNGSLDNSLTISGTPNNPSNFLFIGADPGIGGCGSSRYQYSGSLDEMRIWNIARSASQISSNYAATVASNSSNLIAYYQFNSSSGTTAVDATSNSYNGSFPGAPTWAASTAGTFASYLWSPGGATTQSIAVNSAGTYTITVTDANGCNGSASQVITVNQPATSTTNLSICPSSLPYTWNGLTFNGAGTQTANLTTSGGCDSAATLNLTVKQATSSSNTANVCSNQLPYVWNGLTFNGAGTQTKHLTNSVGCDSAATLTVTVGSPITPSVNISTANTTVCSSQDVTFTANGTNPGPAPVYQWKKNGTGVGSGSSITFPAGTLSSGDAISCTLTANNSCQTTSTANSNDITLTVLASPAIGSSTMSSSVMCTLGSTRNVYNSNTSGGGVWSSSNNSIATVTTFGGANGAVTAQSNGTATVTYTKTAANGCTSTAGISVIVAEVAPINTINGLSSICKNSSTSLNTSSPGGVWSSQNVSASVTTGGVVTGTGVGTAVIAYTVTNANGCSASATKNITVNAIPNVPSIGYAAGSINPQTGAGGGYCNNKSFTLEGTPAGGTWSSTGGMTIHPVSGAAATVALGAASVTYTITSAGCSNSRAISGNVVTCASRGVNTNVLATNDTKFTLYPNPARTFISLNVHSLIGSGSVIITDLYGKQVKQQVLGMGNNTIDVTRLAKGMYMVSIVTTDGKKTEKLIIE